MYLLLILAMLVVVGLAMLIKAAISAPEGYEDTRGFHALNPGDLASAPAQTGNAFTLEELLGLEPRTASQPWR